jgi:hypothetical protein
LREIRRAEKTNGFSPAPNGGLSLEDAGNGGKHCETQPILLVPRGQYLLRLEKDVSGLTSQAWNRGDLSLNWRRRRDLNPRDPFESNGFQDRRIQPLCHSSTRENSIFLESAAQKFGQQVPVLPKNHAALPSFRRAALSFFIASTPAFWRVLM